MIVLKGLDADVKRYILLHAKIDSLSELETAIKFYDANIKILTFADSGRGRDRRNNNDIANPLNFKGRWKGEGRGEGQGER